MGGRRAGGARKEGLSLSTSDWEEERREGGAEEVPGEGGAAGGEVGGGGDVGAERGTGTARSGLTGGDLAGEETGRDQTIAEE